VNCCNSLNCVQESKTKIRDVDKHDGKIKSGTLSSSSYLCITILSELEKVKK